MAKAALQASYPPLHNLELFTSGAYHSRLCGLPRAETHAFLAGKFPNTHKAAWQTVWLPQPVLLGSEAEMYQVLKAIRKIQHQARELL